MHRITLLFILCLLIPDIYIYFAHIVRKAKHSLTRLSYWLPSLLLMAVYFYYIHLSGDNPMSEHTQAIGRMAVVSILLLAPKLVFMLCSMVGVLVHAIARRCPRTPFTAIGLILACICFANILYGSIWGITRFEVKQVEYTSPLLPEGFDGYRAGKATPKRCNVW